MLIRGSVFSFLVKSDWLCLEKVYLSKQRFWSIIKIVLVIQQFYREDIEYVRRQGIYEF